MSPETRLLSENELRESIAAIGPLLGVYRYQGAVLDGNRRLKICRALRVPIDEVPLESRRDAARLLWEVHPERALNKFDDGTLVDAAQLFGVRPATVALARKRLLERPAVPRIHHPGHRRRRALSAIELEPCEDFYSDTGSRLRMPPGQRAVKIQFYMSTALREQMRRARGSDSEAAFMRRAILDECKRRLDDGSS